MFVQVADNVDMARRFRKKSEMSKKDLNEDTAEFNPQLFLLPMKDWYLRNNFRTGQTEWEAA